MRVLVTFGSKRGGTQGLARAIADALVQEGHQVDIEPAQAVHGLDAWDAVIIGGALYAFRWQKHARRFVQRHTDELQNMPVWLFSSGPLDDSASTSEIAPTGQVRKLMERVRARGHITFGGRLEPEAKGFIAQNMVKQGHAGDWRDMDRARAWARDISSQLASEQPGTAPPRHRPVTHGRARRHLRRALVALCLFTGITAMAGGAELLRWPHGDSPWLKLPVSVLQHSPFSDFVVPGLLLFWVVGVSNLVAGVLVARYHRWAEIVAFGSGSALTGWIVVEMIMLRMAHWLQLGYLGVGLATMAAALWLWQLRRAIARSRAQTRQPSPSPS